MAPLLKSLYRPSQRSLLSSLFTATFLGAVIVVAFPCPVRPGPGMGGAMLQDRDQHQNQDRQQDRRLLDNGGGEGYRMGRGNEGQVVVLMNKRGRRFMEES